jgi:hypothetical protein
MDERTLIAALAALQRSMAETQGLLAELVHEIARDRAQQTPPLRSPCGAQDEGPPGESPEQDSDEVVVRGNRAGFHTTQSEGFVAREAGEETGCCPSPARVDEIKNLREPLPVMATSAVWFNGERTELAGDDRARKASPVDVPPSGNLPAASCGVAGLSGAVTPDPGMPAFLRRADGAYTARLLAMHSTMPEGAHAG